ncbi:MAG: rRNA pseudouridine synthase [Clostridia bacterium]|nr:rRNA pseudouridine synthase [Clostridia bacterium]
MRIDKLLTHEGIASRKEAGRLAKSGRITVNGVPVRSADTHIDPEKDTVCVNGTPVIYKQYIYIMLNKPAGYVSATEDGKLPTVLELLPDDLQDRGLFPCGRLDKDTLGLMILTNDGDSAHRRLSPKHHAEKSYAFECKLALEHLEELEKGATLEDGYVTLPSKIEQTGEKSGIITLTEGKYHQIKRMFASVGNKITYLERITFAGIELDRSLERGQWRYLSAAEEALFTRD